jgi:hypothetical protein
MNLTKALAPVALAAALTMSACTSTPQAAPVPPSDVPYISQSLATPVATPPAVVKAPTHKTPVKHTLKPAAKPVAKVATPPADTITAPAPVVPAAAPAPAPVAPTAAVKPAPVIKGQTSASGQTFRVPPHAEPAPVAHKCTGHEAPGLCNMAGGPGIVIPSRPRPVTQPLPLISVVVHYTGGVITSCDASVYASTTVIRCTPNDLKIQGNLYAAYQVPCTLSGKYCTATLAG